MNRRGNAVLFSLIIMASAMTISLGMASLVVGEIRSVALVLPSERAYYRAESYVEQALWEKKADPDYEFNPAAAADGQADPPVGQQLSATYLCGAAPCFSPPPPGPPTPPSDQATLLKEFFATSSLQQPTVALTADVPRQFDVAFAGRDGSGTIKLSNITGAAGYRGLEVTIIAYPTAGGSAPQFPADDPNTAAVEEKFTSVFVDKIMISGDRSDLGRGDGQTTTKTIPINTGEENPVGESYPALDSSNVYRLRIRALGADASADLAVVNGGGRALKLRSPDFTVRSVAEDSKSQRGIQVVVPAASQVASIFDFVLFSDLDLTKLKAKVAGTKLITATAYEDQNRNCVRDVGEPPLPGLTVTAHPSSGSDSTASTDSTGSATFTNLQSGMNYSVTATLSTGYTACTPPGNPQTATFAADNTNEAKALTYLIKVTPRVPLYRAYAWYFGGTLIADHFYTVNWNEWNAAYSYEGIAGYLYGVQVPGTQPLYRMYNSPNYDHFYTMSGPEKDNAVALYGYTYEGITGYLDPYPGAAVGCPTGSAPLYRSYDPNGVDHFYTMSYTEWVSALNGGWYNEGITGCMWTTP